MEYFFKKLGMKIACWFIPGKDNRKKIRKLFGFGDITYTTRHLPNPPILKEIDSVDIGKLSIPTAGGGATI